MLIGNCRKAPADSSGADPLPLPQLAATPPDGDYVQLTPVEVVHGRRRVDLSAADPSPSNIRLITESRKRGVGRAAAPQLPSAADGVSVGSGVGPMRGDVIENGCQAHCDPASLRWHKNNGSRMTLGGGGQALVSICQGVANTVDQIGSFSVFLVDPSAQWEIRLPEGN